MILTCPECATSYFVDDSRIAAGGRTVKCSSCGARWTALPEGSDERAPPTPPPPPPPPPRPAPTVEPAIDELVVDAPSLVIERRPAPARPEATGKVAIWAASAVVAALLIAAAIVFRAQVVQMLPASQAAYAGLGMPAASATVAGPQPMDARPRRAGNPDALSPPR